ncbi:hypothetical protein AB0M45_28205 [Nocardia sp. NPDC051787]|uniref:hypothetical protein n=1 Tax=Nocardia sp. NPDC051787 TaxID=3155415 RepID=UPI00342C741E
MTRAKSRGSADIVTPEARAAMVAQNITVSVLTRTFRDIAHTAADSLLVRSVTDARAMAEAARGLADSARTHSAAGECGLARMDADFADALAAAARDTATRAQKMADAAITYESRLAEENAATARFAEPLSRLDTYRPPLETGTFDMNGGGHIHDRFRTEPAFPTATNDSVRRADALEAIADDDASRTRATKARAAANALAASADDRARSRAKKITQIAQDAVSAAAEATRAAEDAAKAANDCTGADDRKGSSAPLSRFAEPVPPHHTTTARTSSRGACSAILRLLTAKSIAPAQTRYNPGVHETVRALARAEARSVDTVRGSPCGAESRTGSSRAAPSPPLGPGTRHGTTG